MVNSGSPYLVGLGRIQIDCGTAGKCGAARPGEHGVPGQFSDGGRRVGYLRSGHAYLWQREVQSVQRSGPGRQCAEASARALCSGREATDSGGHSMVPRRHNEALNPTGNGGWGLS
jgi:hypothetical protein